MHELSVALGIVKLAESETKKANKTKVEEINLEIGSLAGVELVSLKYVWETAVKGSVLEGAKLNINYLEAKAKCFECKTVFKMDKIFDSCTNCNSHFKEILQGKEMRISTLQVV